MVTWSTCRAEGAVLLESSTNMTMDADVSEQMERRRRCRLFELGRCVDEPFEGCARERQRDKRKAFEQVKGRNVRQWIL